MSNFELQLDSKKLSGQMFAALLGGELLLVLADIFINHNKLIPIGSVQRLFNVAREDSLAACFSWIQCLAVGMVIWLIYLRVRKTGWAVIAAFFTYLAVDDGAKVHERIGTAVKTVLRGAADDDVKSDPSLFPSYTWQIVFVPLFAGMGFYILHYIWREARSARIRWLVFAGLACYGTAVGLDYIEGLDKGYDTVASIMSLNPKAVSHFGRVIEEFLEMFGTTFFLIGFGEQFAAVSPRTVVTFK
ncbi:MAG: hypothetical protein AB7F86_18855 [Bdellovibrionales bacterium]